MTLKIKTLLVGASALALAACSDTSSFNKEAGAFIDEGAFGNPTMNNTLIMNGDQQFLANLNQRFAAEVPTMVTFEFDRSVLDGDARAILNEQADWIRQFPEIRFSVFGHTDLVGTDAYNKALGMRRARAVVNYLVSQGVNRSRLKAQVSFGETRPVIDTQDRERRNRRTVTEVSGVVQSHPMVLNGKYAEIIFRDYVGSAQSPATLGGGGLEAIEGQAGN
ncbi:MAG: OmpA family protein [Paracoccaceae bacterium]|nr:OmpA family protein [Paracoccaceae bacterium]